jgi:hypothetical protein
MNPLDRTSKPSSVPQLENDTDGPSVADGLRPNAPMPPTGRLVAWALGAGLLAGVASWLIGELARDTFRPPLYQQNVMGHVLMKATFADQSSADFRNATLAFAVLGGFMGGVLGIAGGLARRSTAAGTKAAAVGVVFGSLVGAICSLGLLPVYFRALDVAQEQLSRDLVLPLMIHSGIWAACGLAAGIAFGLGLGVGMAQVARSGIGGLIGAALGACIYEITGAMVFADHMTTSPLSLTWSTRLLARLLVATLSAVMAAVFVSTAAGHTDGSIRTP